MRKICVIIIGMVALACIAACSVTRTTSTKSQYVNQGDSVIVIQTTTTESYDAAKKE